MSLEEELLSAEGAGDSATLPLRGLTSSARPRLRSRADGVSSMVCGPGSHCPGRPWNPHFSVWTAGAFTGFHPERLGLRGDAPTGHYHLQSSVLWLGDLQRRVCLFGGSLPAEDPSFQYPHPLPESVFRLQGECKKLIIGGKYHKGSWPLESNTNPTCGS